MSNLPPPTKIVTEPVYRQLAGLCRAEIAGGRFKSGDRFWSERELSAAYRISRATANKVLSAMVAEGLLDHRPGIGTFVTGARGLGASLKEMESFTGHARAEGFTPSTRVLDFRKIPLSDAPAPARAALGDLPGPESLFKMVRLRLADEVPVILETRWIRASKVPDLSKSDLAGSLYDLLESRFGLALTGESLTLSARNASPAEAASLGVKRGAAVLVAEGTGFAAEREPLWYHVLLHRGDRYHLRHELGARGDRHATFVQYKSPEKSNT